MKANRRARIALSAVGSLLVVALAAGWALAARAGVIGPDVTVFSLSGTMNYGASGGIRAYSLGTVSCNRGDTPLNWCDNGGDAGCGLGTTDEDHPVIAQNLYRLKDGRFEQIGLSWLKHGFVSTNSTTGGCTGSAGQSCQQPPLGGNQLGVGCTDPYGAGLNGSRPLGPRSEVNASTGEFPFPHGGTCGGGNCPTVIEQRIQVKENDLDAALNPGALYWMEGQYIAPDDAQSGNGFNNASHRTVTVGAAPNYNLTLTGSTVQQIPAVFAWQTADPEVDIVAVDVPGSSPVERFHVGRRVTDLGGGDWHYEYAVHNHNSDRSARSFAVQFPLPTAITNVGHHDVDHHSGEPYATTDWAASTAAPNAVSWATDDFATDPDANALRWATMFSFWFDADSPPAGTQHTLGLFKPGSPSSVVFFFDSLIFADAFETGDTSGWSLLCLSPGGEPCG
jgi:hypothetical protein